MKTTKNYVSPVTELLKLEFEGAVLSASKPVTDYSYPNYLPFIPGDDINFSE